MRPIKSGSRKPQQGILLDVGCGGAKFGPLWTGIDKRAMDGVDVVHDLETFPWPIASESVQTARVSHVLEHIKPWLTLSFLDELWRVMKIGGPVHIAAPYGVSSRFVQDPTHCNPINETTWMYFDPQPPGFLIPKDNLRQMNVLYSIYRPRPWRIARMYFDQVGDIEVLLEKREDDGWSFASTAARLPAPLRSRRSTGIRKR